MSRLRAHRRSPPGHARQRHRGEHADQLVADRRPARRLPARAAAGTARSPGQARSHAATPRCCSTASPSRHPSASPASARRAQLLIARRRRRDRRQRRSSVALHFRARSARASARSTERGCTRIPNRSAIASASSRRAQRRIRCAPLARERDDLVGELVRPPRPGPGRHQPGQPAAVQRRAPPHRTTAARTRTPPPSGSPASPSTRTRRTISYLTCTRSRASKNSEPGERARRAPPPGRGFKLRSARSAATFGSSPASRHHHSLYTSCKTNYAVLIGRNHRHRRPRRATSC